MSEIRQKAIDYMNTHKRSWVGLGKVLYEINQSSEYKEWGHEKFNLYITDELGLAVGTAKQMMMAYEYLLENRPALLNTLESDPEAYVPDFRTIVNLNKLEDDDQEKQELEDKLFDETNPHADKEIREAIKSSPEDPLEEIKNKTKKIKKAVKRVVNQIEDTSSFNNEVRETAHKLVDLVDGTEI